MAEGQQLRVELLGVPDGERGRARPRSWSSTTTGSSPPRTELAGTVVAARIVGQELGPKIRGFTYQAKARRRRRWGHRQHYATVEISVDHGPRRAAERGGQAGGCDMSKTKGGGSTRNGRDSNAQAPRREGVRRDARSRPVPSSCASGGPSSIPVRTSAAVATTRCSPPPTAWSSSAPARVVARWTSVAEL